MLTWRVWVDLLPWSTTASSTTCSTAQISSIEHDPGPLGLGIHLLGVLGQQLACLLDLSLLTCGRQRELSWPHDGLVAIVDTLNLHTWLMRIDMHVCSLTQ